MSVFRTCILLYNSIYLRPEHTLDTLPLIRSDNHGDLDLSSALLYSMSLLVSSSAPLYRYLFMHSILCFIHEDDLPMEMEVRVCRGFIWPSSIQKGSTACLSLLIRSTHQNKTNPGGRSVGHHHLLAPAAACLDPVGPCQAPDSWPLVRIVLFPTCRSLFFSCVLRVLEEPVISQCALVLHGQCLYCFPVGLEDDM